MLAVDMQRVRDRKVYNVLQNEARQATKRVPEGKKVIVKDTARMDKTQYMRDMAAGQSLITAVQYAGPKQRSEKDTPEDLRPKRNERVMAFVDPNEIAKGDYSQMKQFMPIDNFARQTVGPISRDSIRHEENKKKRDEYWEQEKAKKKDLIQTFRKKF